MEVNDNVITFKDGIILTAATPKSEIIGTIFSNLDLLKYSKNK